jgi:hypothetical protein
MSKKTKPAAKKPAAPPKPEAAKERPSTAAVATAAATATEDKITYQERMRKMKPHERVRAKLEATIERFQFIVEEIETWKNAGNELTQSAKGALTAIEEVTDLVKSLPKDFVADKPRKAPVSSLEVGTRVDLRAKHAETYDGVIADKDRAGLEVLGVRKGRVVCKTISGEKVIIPRGHVEVSAIQPAPKKTKAA